MSISMAAIGLSVVAATGAASATGGGVLEAWRTTDVAASGASTLSGGQDATNCVRLQNPADQYSAARLHNACAFTIEVSWCAEGVDCQNGMSNMRTFGSGDSYPVNGTGARNPPRTIRWGACVGVNSISTTFGQMGYACRDPL